MAGKTSKSVCGSLEAVDKLTISWPSELLHAEETTCQDMDQVTFFSVSAFWLWASKGNHVMYSLVTSKKSWEEICYCYVTQGLCL